ncbi:MULTISPECIES: Sec-independent protein translocase protein TatB [Pseudoalteromonas]|uniref:Translocase n=2 Tax=Pseudoalteromonas TaxID=53246 RepID=A0A0F4PRV1_9GAMM|nr:MULTISPECIES: Sec-independent protein translocase protein TatB [Pseudoalteromonas]KJY95410.1 translocase [Pseudoalteromonas ruthenica]KJY96976.1 translocase [Pseudoalteromonas ruthenica]MCF2863880.1 Sec-independent protein translocase protein TatB [Pseudoalteromonas sp. CNAT2-18]MCG7545217.1 Sec-independent protein translocase protein TatB [Pseudoalteromonas sp. MM17-2]MCG7559801.1 Sec-independent protein translocase protein TatB [Pseudoalteromonas sp. CNAT2-18.1]|tara:strand:- start:3728 stop:4048 length:321 start_codon:yes stop_codon:yes gene_type:complete
MGMWELLVVFVVGLIVLGPERLPVAIRTVSRWVKTAKGMANNISAQVNEELRVHELHQNLKKAEQQNMENLPDDVKDSVAELHKAAQSVTRSYDNAPKKDSSNKDE